MENVKYIGIYVRITESCCGTPKLTQHCKLTMRVCLSVAQSCLTLCDPVDCSPPGSFIHGVLQARTQEWVAIPFSRGSSQPRDRTQVSCAAGRVFTVSATREAQINYTSIINF